MPRRKKSQVSAAITRNGAMCLPVVFILVSRGGRSLNSLYYNKYDGDSHEKNVWGGKL